MPRTFKPTPGGWERRKVVQPRIVEGGSAQVMCPYCPRPHPLPLNEAAACGTRLEIRAVQKVYKGVTCALCGGALGTMVRIGENYKHSHQCTPGKELYAAPPPASRSAALFWHAPKFIHYFMARNLKRAPIELKQNGKVVGYAWERIEIHDRQTNQVPAGPGAQAHRPIVSR